MNYFIVKGGFVRYILISILILITSIKGFSQSLIISDSLYRVAESFYTEGQMNVAARLFLQSAEIESFCPDGSYKNISGALFNAAVCFEAANDFVNADSAYTKLLFFATEAKDTSTLASVYLYLSRFAMSEARFDQALAYADESLNLFKLSTDRKGQVESVVLIADQFIFHGRYDEAIMILTTLLHSQESLNEKDVLPVIEKIAFVYRKSNIPDSAVKYYSILLTSDYKGNNYADIAEHSSMLADCFFQLGEYSEALKYYQISSQFFKLTDDKIGLGVSLSQCGKILSIIGRYELAIHDLNSALQIFNQESFQEGISNVFMVYGAVYERKMQFDSAYYYYENARRIAIYSSDSFLQNKINGLISKMYMHIGDQNSAINLYAQVIAETPSHHFNEKSTSLYSLGMLYSQIGRDSDAFVCFDEALILAMQSQNYDVLGKLYLSLGDLWFNDGMYNEALRSYQSSLEAFSRIRSVENVIFSYNKIGKTYLKLDQIENSIAAYRTGYVMSIHTCDKVSAAMIYQGISEVFEKHAISDSSLYYLIKASDLYRQGGDRVHLSECLNGIGYLYLLSGELDKALKVLNECESLINTIRVGSSDSIPDGLNFILTNCLRNLSSLYAIRSNVEQAYKYREMVSVNDIIVNIPSCKTQLSVLSFEDLKKKNEINSIKLIYIETSTDELYSLVLGNECSYITPVDLKRLAISVLKDDKVRKYIDTDSICIKENLNLSIFNDDISKLTQDQAFILYEKIILCYFNLLSKPGFDKDITYRVGSILYESLIDPIKDKLTKINNICISADGVLQNLPFESLPISNESYFVSRYRISYMHSISVGTLLNKRTFCANEFLFARYNSDSSLHSISNGLIDLISDSEKRQIKLAFSQINDFSKLEGIYSRLGYSINDSLVGVSAEQNDSIIGYAFQSITEFDLKKKSNSGKLLDYKYIHFDTKTISVPRVSGLSALKLISRDGEDGFLSFHEIESLKLNADLVSIIGYNPDFLNYQLGDIKIYIPFFVAGANSVLVSLWNTDTTFSINFFNVFYSYLQTNKMSPSEALFKTKNEFLTGMHGFTWSLPYFWASFVVNSAY